MMTTVEMVLLLKGIELFADLGGEDLAAIALMTRIEEAAAGDTIIREGELGDTLYFVVEGTVQVIKAGQVVAELRERDVFGELALLDPEPRSASVVATEETTLLCLGRDDFVNMMAARPEVPLGVIKTLVRRARAALDNRA